MDVAELKQTGYRFSFCRACMMPEIPRVVDVLYALRFFEEQEYYDYCAANHQTYIENVMYVAAAVCDAVLALKPYNAAKVEQIIAAAIAELCPDEARCLNVPGYYAARKVMGDEIPPLSATTETMQQACGCAQCQEMIRERERDACA